MNAEMADLVARFRSGDERAAAELYARYRAKLTAFVRSNLRHAENPVPCDGSGIVQSAFRVWFGLMRGSHFDDRQGEVGGLLWGIMRNKLWSALRKKNPIGCNPHDLEGHNEAVVVVPTDEQTIKILTDGQFTEPEVAAFANEIVPALAPLTKLERKAVCLYLDDERPRSDEEIARLCGRGVTFVKRAIRRFKEELRKQLPPQRCDENGRDG